MRAQAKVTVRGSRTRSRSMERRFLEIVMRRVIVHGGKLWRIVENPPVEFGAYLMTSYGLLLVDRVLHCADMIVVDCVSASEDSWVWAGGLLRATGGTPYQLVEIQQSG